MFIDFQMPFVFRKVAALMAQRQYPPMRWAKIQRMLQTLKNNVTVLRAVAMSAQGRKCQRMGSVVAQIEAALDGKRFYMRIFQPRTGGAYQAVESVPDADPDLKKYVTVAESIGHLPPLAAGETHPTIKNHRSRALSDITSSA